jgi:hypothetical protein
MRKKWSKISTNAVLILLFATPYSNAFGGIEVGSPIEFLESIVVGQCFLIISYDEPYDALSSECELTKDNVQKAHHEITAFDIGWPRPVIPPFYKTWPTLAMMPSDDAVYCQKFARSVDDAMLFYHHSDLELSIIHDGVSLCESVEGEIKAYPQIQCLGEYSIVIGTGALIPGVHLSFSFANDPHCWVNGYISLEE